MREHKKKFIKNSVGLLIAFLITFAFYFIICSQYGQIPLKFGIQWLKPFFDAKIEIANNQTSPKLILLGGSSVDFSISAEQIEKELAIPTVNFGSTAELAEYIFHVVKKAAKSGDTILMPLEYHYYYCKRKNPFQPVMVRDRYLLYYDQEYYQSLPLYDRVATKASGFRDLIRMMDEDNWDYEKYKKIDEALNQNGDENKTEPENKPPKLKEVDWPIEFYSSFESKFENEYCAKKLTAFIDWAKENDVQVIATYPTLYDFDGAYYKGRYPEIFRLIEKFYQDRDVPVLGNPYDAMYPYEDFFNTGYHLHSVARVEHTEKVIALLRNYFSVNLAD